MTLTSRTPNVTGGSQDSSTTRSRSASLRPPTEVDGLTVDGVVVPNQDSGTHVHGGGLLGILTIPGGQGLEREIEALGPALGHPDLFATGHCGQVIVLDPGQVPDEPGNGIGLVVDPKGQRLDGDAVEDGMDRPANSPEPFQQYPGAIHDDDLPDGDSHTVRCETVSPALATPGVCSTWPGCGSVKRNKPTTTRLTRAKPPGSKDHPAVDLLLSGPP